MIEIHKQAIIVRKDLKWGKGKLATHVAHASLGAALASDQRIVSEWNGSGAKKVVLKVRDLKEMKDVERAAKKMKFVTFLVRDAGLTQLKEGTVTALAIGPVEERKIDKVTGKLKLL